MAYVMHRVFCAAPGDLGEEVQAFYKVMSELNAEEAMPRGILFVSVALPPLATDKRPYQAAISENVRACRYYVQVLEDTWGPPQLNFEREYALATRCTGDPAQPMQEVAVFFKKPLLPHQVEAGLTAFKQQLESENHQPHYDFSTLDEFKAKLRAQLSTWLQTVQL